MKYIFIILLLMPFFATSQSKINNQQFIEGLKKYTYRVQSLKSYNTGSGFFIEYEGNKYIVTARHIFYDIKTKIWTNSISSVVSFENDFVLEIPFDKEHKNVIPVTYKGLDIDLVLIKVPEDSIFLKINYVNISDSIKIKDIKNGMDAYLIGYPLGSRKTFIHKSKLSYDLLEPPNWINVNLCLKDSSVNGMSGGPVFVIKMENKKLISCLIGIDFGTSPIKDCPTGELITSSYFLFDFLKRLRGQ